MVELELQDRVKYTNSNIGAIICRTPKTLNDTNDIRGVVDNRCVLIDSTNKLEEYFGDPYINPKEYTDLIIARRLVESNIPVFISSLYDMKDNDDGFDIKYNGFTEFTFKDKYKHMTITYKLKSNIKFCQPIINSEFNVRTLDLYVHLYLLDRSIKKDVSDINKLDISKLYKILHFKYNTDNVTDKDIIDDFKLNGLELKIINTRSDTSLIEELKQYSILKVSLLENNTDNYHYEINSNKYDYCLDNLDVVYKQYTESIDRLKERVPEPHILCLGKMFKSITNKDSDNNIINSYTTDLDPEYYLYINNYLLHNFNEECNTYLFISTPDVSINKILELLDSNNEYGKEFQLIEQYNCDLFYGYSCDYIDSSLFYNSIVRVYYSTAVLSLYNLLLSQSMYLTNGIINLNIPVSNIKSIISESSSKKLLSNRCNSTITFETGLPSIYGSRSLSRLPNLQYSHISRYFVIIRRIIREYLESQKFIINTIYNVQSCINYVNHFILEEYVQLGILYKYETTYSIQDKTIVITVNLTFNGIAESISLNITI